MSCNPCAITVNPQKVGLVVDYLAGGARPEYKAGGFVVRPQNIGVIIAACKIPAVGPSEIIIEPVSAVGITAIVDTDEIIVTFDQELDPVCNWENGVTITVDGSPVNILSVTPTGAEDPWGYDYEVDVTLTGGQTIVWSYDPAAGDLCALNGATLGPTTIPTTVPFLPIGQGSFVYLNDQTFTTLTGTITGWDNDVLGSGGSTYDLTRFGNFIPESSINGLTAAQSQNTSPRILIPVTSGTLTVGTGFTLFAVGGFDSASTGAKLFDSQSGGDRVYLGDVGGNLEIGGNNIGTLSSIPADTSMHVWAVRMDSGNYRSRISGEGAWTTSATVVNQGFDYCSLLSDAVTVTQSVSRIGLYLLYDTPLSDAEMDEYYAQLKVKYNIL